MLFYPIALIGVRLVAYVKSKNIFSKTVLIYSLFNLLRLIKFWEKRIMNEKSKSIRFRFVYFS